jgi:lipid-binding SYLF domain-containing protein
MLSFQVRIATMKGPEQCRAPKVYRSIVTPPPPITARLRKFSVHLSSRRPPKKLEFSPMTFRRPTLAAALMTMAAIVAPIAVPAAQASTAAQIAADGRHALHDLEEHEPKTRLFAHHARAVLVFPSMIKAGLVFGGESGHGVLFIDGQPVGYYNLSGGSFGLQIGAEKFGLALFFMNDSSLRYLRKSGGFAIGTGPSLALIDKGAAASADTTTLSKDVYAFPFSEKGLMADLTLQGTKITEIHPR